MFGIAKGAANDDRTDTRDAAESGAERAQPAAGVIPTTAEANLAEPSAAPTERPGDGVAREATATPQARAAEPPPRPALDARPPEPAAAPARAPVVALDGWQAFLDGYFAAGGRVDWGIRFVSTLQCEGSSWAGYYGPWYYTRAQFSADTWVKVVAHLGTADPDDPYFVGQAVAWWSSQADPAGQWPTCWYTK